MMTAKTGTDRVLVRTSFPSSAVRDVVGEV